TARCRMNGYSPTADQLDRCCQPVLEEQLSGLGTGATQVTDVLLRFSSYGLLDDCCCLYRWLLRCIHWETVRVRVNCYPPIQPHPSRSQFRFAQNSRSAAPRTNSKG